ncbi:MAG: DUF1294 domain-containing protein [Clostridia bacterium]|nr:DUF1294 domain-containing protein [Clostridia bacterium]
MFTDFRFIIIIIYLIVINIIAMAMYGFDKHKAKNGKWRTSENTLLLLAALGGSIGAIIGMKAFHHKTKKAAFSIGVPIVLILQILLAIFLIAMVCFNII